MYSTVHHAPELFTHWPVGGLQHKPLPYPMTRGEVSVFVLAVLGLGAVPLWPMVVLGGQLFDPGLARVLPAAAWLFVLAPLLVRVVYKRLARRRLATMRWQQHDMQARAAEDTDRR